MEKKGTPASPATALASRVYTNPHVPEMSPILEFMITYIMPTALLIGAFVLFMNLMTRKGGGIGGTSNSSNLNGRLSNADGKRKP